MKLGSITYPSKEPFRYLLLTPGILDEASLKGKLIWACRGRPIPIGGWDYSKKTHKKTEFAFPPGSVFILDGLDSSEWHLRPRGGLKTLGFGLGICAQLIQEVSR